MGIFNATSEISAPDSISAVKFNIDLSTYATKKQYKMLKREMESYLHKNKELDNKMNRPLDMGGNEIINLGNPDKPNDAVSRRFIFRKIQSVISDYNLEDIKAIKKTLETESENIEQLTKDIKANEKTIIELQGKIEKEMKTITETMEELEKSSDATDDQIKKVFGENIKIIHDQIKELKEKMIQQDELKEKLTEAEKRLQNMYQLEIKTEISKLNQDTAKRNSDLLDNFLSRFAQYKAELEREVLKAKGELEKTASERGDGHDKDITELTVAMNNFKKQMQDLLNITINRHNANYNNLSNLIGIIQEDIANINNKIQEIEKNVDFAIEKSTKQGEALDKQNTVFEKSIIDLDNLTKNILPKRLTDIGDIVLNLVQDNKSFKRKLSKLDKAVYEIPLFELYNNRVQEVALLTVSIGIPEQYGIKTNELEQVYKTSDFFALFGLSPNPTIEYTDYLKVNHPYEIKRGIPVVGFQVKKKGRYIFKINLISKGQLEGFNLYWTSGRDDRGSRVEFIEKDKKKTHTLELETDMFVFIYPVTDSNYTIEPGSYVEVTYSWKDI